MTNSQSTKRALLASVLSVVLCFAMLIGSTFAWFTDSVTSGKNKIVAGNLKVDLIHVGGGEEGADVSIKDTPDHKIFNYDQWEPGYTAMETLKVVNKGSLAFKFRLDAIASGATAAPTGEKLADVIDVYVYEGDGIPTPTSFAAMTEDANWRNAGSLSELMADPDGMAYGVLLPADATPKNDEPVKEVQMTVALHMQEGAGNAYQGLTLGDLSFVLNATQYTFEDDAFDDQYDKDAEYLIGSVAREKALVAEGYMPVATPEDLAEAIQKDDVENIVLTDDVEIGIDYFKGDNKIKGVIDANGKSIIAKGTHPYQSAGIYGKGEIRNAVMKADVVWGYYIVGTSFYNCTFDCSPYVEPTMDVTIDGCSFVNGGNLQLVYLESQKTDPKDITVTITNNTFEVPDGEKQFGLTFITYKSSADIWSTENWSEYIVVKDNTFTPADGQASYTAIWITDPSKEVTLESAPSFAGNKFVGGAKLLLNQDKDLSFSLS